MNSFFLPRWQTMAWSVSAIWPTCKGPTQLLHLGRPRLKEWQRSDRPIPLKSNAVVCWRFFCIVLKSQNFVCTLLGSQLVKPYCGVPLARGEYAPFVLRQYCDLSYVSHMWHDVTWFCPCDVVVPCSHSDQSTSYYLANDLRELFTYIWKHNSFRTFLSCIFMQFLLKNSRKPDRHPRPENLRNNRQSKETKWTPLQPLFYKYCCILYELELWTYLK